MDSLQSMLTMEKKECENECFLSFVVKIFSSPIHVTKNHFQKWSSWYENKIKDFRKERPIAPTH